jgi:hypothetical protein
MRELRSSTRRIAGAGCATEMPWRLQRWPRVHRRLPKDGLGRRVAWTAILVFCFQALAAADSYIPPLKALVIPDCRTYMTRSCDLKRAAVTSGPHWLSSLRLNTGSEDIQIQIRRAVWTAIRPESLRGPRFHLPTNPSGGTALGNQLSRSDGLQDFLIRIVRKLLLSDHAWRKKASPRCRNNPGAAGCD